MTLPHDDREDFDHNIENVIEFFRDSETTSVTFTQRRYITRIKELAEKYPDECKILAENKDGSIFAHIPTKWVKIAPPREVSEEQREKLRERCRVYGFKKQNCGAENS